MLKTVTAVALILGVVVVAAACAQRSQVPSPKDPVFHRPAYQDQVRSALVRLLERPSEDGGFVVIADPDSGRFVQFSGSQDFVEVDLPHQTLSAEDMVKTKAVFSALGYAGPKTYGEQTTFQENFGKDVNKATELAVAILQQVYALEDHTVLKLTESSF